MHVPVHGHVGPGVALGLQVGVQLGPSQLTPGVHFYALQEGWGKLGVVRAEVADSPGVPGLAGLPRAQGARAHLGTRRCPGGTG